MNYKLLPFRYLFLKNRVLLTNYVGDYIWIEKSDFEEMLAGVLSPDSKLFEDLKSIFIISSGDIELDTDILAVKYRSKKSYLDDFTSLHMVVTTLRCNQHCRYCQATAESESDTSRSFDMSTDIALKVAETIMKSPGSYLTVEFQGGEPTLNFSAIKTVVERVLELNTEKNKRIDFVVCTNLFHVETEMLEYFRYRNVGISTSIDGPAFLHDKHRINWDNNGTYNRVIKNLETARSFLGDNIGVLMTTTRDSLNHYEEIIDEYVRLGLHNIFFRSLNPYGRCITNNSELSYPIEDFICAFKRGLRYIIDLNKRGIHIREGYTSLLLKRMLTPFSTGFVDLQSPCGAGISGVIYNYNGNVYCCDEGRMLSAMGDEYFCMGHVQDGFSKLFDGELIHKLVENSIVDTIPECCDCAFKMWCGADPVRQYATNGKLIEKKVGNDFCKKHKMLFEFILELLEEDSETKDILYSWAWGSNC